MYFKDEILNNTKLLIDWKRHWWVDWYERQLHREAWIIWRIDGWEKQICSRFRKFFEWFQKKLFWIKIIKSHRTNNQTEDRKSNFAIDKTKIDEYNHKKLGNVLININETIQEESKYL